MFVRIYNIKEVEKSLNKKVDLYFFQLVERNRDVREPHLPVSNLTSWKICSKRLVIQISL